MGAKACTRVLRPRRLELLDCRVQAWTRFTWSA
jgi:hypothetical protein